MSSRIMGILVIVVGITAAPFCHAGFYKCVDAKGKTTYSDVPCPLGTSETEQAVRSGPSTAGEPSVKSRYLEAAKIYGGMNKDRKEENESADRYNNRGIDAVRSQQRIQELSDRMRR